jgi:predicted mannosyl-3-phosphoglycerate phosphatase (HAD superfamily)
MNPLEIKENEIREYRIYELEKRLNNLEEKHDQLIRSLKIEFYKGK